MTTLCSVGVSCTTVTGHDINFDAGKKKKKKSQGHLLDCSVSIWRHRVKNLFEQASEFTTRRKLTIWKVTFTHLFCTFDSKFRNQGKFPTLEKSQVLGTWIFFQFCNYCWENGNPGAGSKYVYIFFRFADLYFYMPRKS